jgi:hypothetical protein
MALVKNGENAYAKLRDAVLRTFESLRKRIDAGDFIDAFIVDAFLDEYGDPVILVEIDPVELTIYVKGDEPVVEIDCVIRVDRPVL